MKVGINLPARFSFARTETMLSLYGQLGPHSDRRPDRLLGISHPAPRTHTPLSATARNGGLPQFMSALSGL